MKDKVKKIKNKINTCRVIRIILILVITFSFIQFNSYANNNFYLTSKEKFENDKISAIVDSIKSKDNSESLEAWQILDYDYRNFLDKVYIEAKIAEPIKNAKKFNSNCENYNDSVLDKMQRALDYVNSLPTVEGQEEPNKVPQLGGSLRAKSIYLQESLYQSGLDGDYYPILYVELKSHKVPFKNDKKRSGVGVMIDDSLDCSVLIYSPLFQAMPGNKEISQY